jgi:hypothetical protein
MLINFVLRFIGIGIHICLYIYSSSTNVDKALDQSLHSN